MSNKNLESRSRKEKALALLKADRLEEAKSICLQISSLDRRDAHAWDMLGHINMKLGEIQDAIDSYMAVIKLQPTSLEAHFNLAVAYQACGKLTEALGVYQGMLKINQNIPEVHCNLGLLMQKLGDNDAAIRSYKKSIIMNPGQPESFYNLGNAYLDKGDIKGAENCFNKALQINNKFAGPLISLTKIHYSNHEYDKAENTVNRILRSNPAHPESCLLLSNILLAQGRLDESVICIHQLLNIHPDVHQAYCVLGEIAFRRNDREASLSAYKKALATDPNSIDALLGIGVLYAESNRHNDAINLWKKIFEIDPVNSQANENLGYIYEKLGEVELAADCYSKALDISKKSYLKIRLATILPVINESAEKINLLRNSFYEKVNALLEEEVVEVIRDPVRELGYTTSTLTYHGLNDRDINMKLARLYEKWVPSLAYKAPHCGSDYRCDGNRLIKIGFLSEFFRSHTIAKLTAGIIEKLSRTHFYVIVFSTSHNQDKMAEFIRSQADEFVELQNNLQEAREVIGEKELDILYYPDIGMTPFSYFLAFSRLAHVQCVTWGHPDTTGIRNIDYFISSSSLETEDADSHYSESLIRLNDLPVYYYKDLYGELSFKPRSNFGLSDDVNVYLCPQTLFKLHPNFDLILGDILRGDDIGEIIFIECEVDNWSKLLMKRLGNSIPDVFDRIKFMPRQNNRDFLSLLKVADVILDTVCFGGGNSTYEALSIAAPIVTMPTDYMRSRVTYACYKKMGFTELVANDRHEYVALALRLANDSAYRKHVVSKISSSSNLLFEDLNVVRELESFFIKAINS